MRYACTKQLTVTRASPRRLWTQLRGQTMKLDPQLKEKVIQQIMQNYDPERQERLLLALEQYDHECPS